MSADGGHMTEVELFPDGAGELDVDAAPGSRPRPPSPPGRPRRSGRRSDGHGLLLTALAVLLVAVVVGAVVESRAVRADAARVQSLATTGAVASLREPVGELWRATGGVVGGNGAVLVVADPHAAGTVVSGLRARTGERLWSRDLLPSRVRCPRTLELEPDALVLCEVRPWSFDGAVPGLLWAVDAYDGTVRARRTVDGRSAGWDVVDGDLVLARRVGGGLRVWREGLMDAVVRWSTVLPLPDGVSAQQVDLRVGDGLVAVAGATGAVLTTDGRLLGRWARGSRGAVAVRTDTDGFAVWTEQGEGRWYDRSGGRGVRLPGEPVDVVDADEGAPGSSWNPLVGDARAGMPPGLLLLRTRGGIAVADVRGRGLVWSRGTARAREVVVMGGVVALATRSEVRVLDLVDGAPLWSAERGLGTDTGRVLTDGLRLLVPGHEADVGRTVTVRSLPDGAVEWTAALPRGATSLEGGPGGLLLARVPGGVVAVGP